MILVDTNVLARLTNGLDPQRDLAKAAIAKLMRDQQELVIAPQCLFEFWVIITRPASDNGLGFSPARAGTWLTRLKRLCRLLPDNELVLQRWQDLVTTHNVLGKKSHDARLAAWMHVHHVTRILTFNAKDFARFGIAVIDPQSL